MIHFENELKPFAGSISKVFVCGAPSMNETFDKAFEEMYLQKFNVNLYKLILNTEKEVLDKARRKMKRKS